MARIDHDTENRAPAVPDEVMFRTEDFAGEGFRDPAEVLAFETYELMNSDAVKYMLEHYLDPGTELYTEAEKLFRTIEADSLPDVDEVKAFFSKCLDEVNRKTEKNVCYGLWLARRETVEDIYCSFTDLYTIDVYETKGGVVLDDLGYDGMYIGFEREVFPVKQIFS